MRIFGRRSLLLSALLFALPSIAADGSPVITAFQSDSNGVTLRSATAIMRVEFCGERVVHVIASPTNKLPSAKVPIVIAPCALGKVRAKAEKQLIKVQSDAVTVTVDRSNGLVTFLKPDGTRVLAEPPEGGRSFNVASAGEPNRWQLQQSFVSTEDEALYGLGQHQEGIFDVRGVPIRLHQANTNISVPFLLSSKGYGLLWNNASLTDFNPADQEISIDESGTGRFRSVAKGNYGFLLTSDNRRQLVLQVDGQEVIGLRTMWTPSSASGTIELDGDKEHEVVARGGPGGVRLFMRTPRQTTTFRSEVGQAIDYYFFYGPDLNRVISEYRRLTGEAPMFPKWAYGYWQCRERYHSQQEILDTAAEFRTRKIPVDVLVQDWQYWGKYGWNAMKFDEQHYPQPQTMMDRLHANDVHLLISIWSRFGEDTEVYKRMRAQSLLIPGTAWTDFFNPAAQKAFWSELKNGIYSTGIDGWWMDASEPEGDALKGRQTFIGSGESVRNAYPLYVTKAIYEGQRATTDQKRVVILTRSAFAGQQRNAAASWSGDITGDWVTFRRQIAAGLSFSMSGLPYWTTDIGGFFRPKDQYTSNAYRELLVRWFQYGAFCPIFRVHGYQSNTEPWNYGPEVEQILTRYDELRYRLLPYIYSAAWNVTHRGGTLMRALPLEFPSDPGARGISDQFMFGPALLISPVTETGARQRKVYLPAGNDWIDFWTGQRAAGGQTITAEAPLSIMPIYAKAGSIVVLGPVVESAAEKTNPIEVRIYPGSNADGELYEDEGDNYNYERGAYSIIPLHWDDNSGTLTIGDRHGRFSGMMEHRTFHIVRVAPGHGTGIERTRNVDATAKFAGKAAKVRVVSGGQNSGAD